MSSLLIYMFCKNCEPESVLPVLQIETKTIFTKINKESIFKKTTLTFWFRCIIGLKSHHTPVTLHCAPNVKWNHRHFEVHTN